jgi:CHAD domain-containing protein
MSKPAARTRTTGSTPVLSLQEHCTALEAALAVCLAGPKPRPVHRLRSESRRLEAQLLLLTDLKGLPPFRHEAARLSGKLHKLRTAAGKVRDLDIHLDLLSALPEAKGRSTEAIALRGQIDSLAAELRSRRDEAGRQLQTLIEAQQASVVARLEALAKALKPAETLRVPATVVLSIAVAAYRRLQHRVGIHPTDRHMKPIAVPATLKDKRLHDLRKAAKLTRYVAESVGSSVLAKQAATRFEAVQAAGGAWHDWLELASEARETLGRKHRLTRLCREHCAHHRAGFLRSLNSVS